jgi:ABC-type antimicrobial peptide transport system permease subunit
MLLIATFAVMALALAGMGIYGVFTYWVNQRRQEMGIRLALGSSRPELLRLIVMQAMRVILAGGLVGIAGACSSTTSWRACWWASRCMTPSPCFSPGL